MKIWIDTKACVGNGVCAELAPEFFDFDGHLAHVRDGGHVPPGLEDAVLDAAEECPAACIYLEDE